MSDSHTPADVCTAQERAIVAEAMSWLRTPYHHKARIKGQAVDCAMLLYAVYVEALQLVPPFDFEDYPGDWMMHRSEERFLSHVEHSAVDVTGQPPRPGDVVMYKVGRCFAHGAIVIEWPMILHACIRTGSVTLADGEQGFLAGRERKHFRVPVAPLEVPA